MSVSELFEEFRENELQISVSSGNLQIVDVKGNLNEALRNKIKLHKQEIIEILSLNEDVDYADFEYAHLNEKSFDEIAKKYPDIQTLFPATSLQKGMFYQEASQAGTCAYTRQIYFDLGVDVDLTRYFAAWENVVNHNEMLKACFMGFDSEDIHVVVPGKISLPLEIVDCSNLNSESALAEFEKLAAHEKAKPFDYTAAPLMRLIAVKMPNAIHKLMWTYHHAILDGWSLPLIVNAIDSIYLGATENVNTTSYMEYVKWLAACDETKAEQWWQQCFADYTHQPLALRKDTAKRDQKTAGETVGKTILEDPIVGKKVLEWTSRNRTTVNCLLHVAWSLVLKRFFNTTETVVGSVISTRPASIENVESIPGLMINTIPVRLRYAAESGLDSMLDQANLQNLSAMEFGTYPLDKIKKIAGCSSDQELFESLIVFYNYPKLSGTAISGESTENMIQSTGFSDESNFPVTILGSRVGDGLSVVLKYDSTQVAEELANDLANAMFCVLVQILSLDCTSKVDKIALAAGEQAVVVPTIRNSTTATPFPIRSGLKGLVQYVANENANKVAVEYEGDTCTFAQINEKTNKLARFLKSQLSESDQRAAVLLDKSMELVEATLACVKASIPVLLLDPKEPVDRLMEKMRVGKIDLLLSHSDFSEDYSDTEFKVIEINDSKIAKRISKENGKTVPSNPAQEANDIVFVTVEGDSSAEFQYREINAEEMFEKLCIYNKRFDNKGGIARACSAAIQSDWFGFGILSAACKGNQLVLINEATDLVVNELLQVDALQISVAELVGLLSRKYSFSGIKNLDIYGGELPEDALSKLQKTCTEIRAYNFVTTARNYLFELARQIHPLVPEDCEGWLSVGYGTEIVVLDDNMNSLPARATGLLCHRMPDEKIQCSGEAAIQLADGSVSLVDVEYQYYFVDGQKIYFNEVEKALCAVSGVISAVVMMRDDAEYEKGSRLVAYLVMENNFVESLNGYTDNEEYYDELFRIKAALSPIVPKSMVPDTFVFMEALPQNENRISIRKNLPNPDKINKERRKHEEAIDDIERKILAFWEGAFLLNGLGVTDDYFDLGGSSLMQIKLLNLINKEFLVELTWEDLFSKKATVRLQATRIKQELGLL